MRVTSKGLRDLLFLTIGTAILYHEIWQEPDPSPLGVFVALFLYGLIPAFRADDASSTGPLALLLQALGALGGKAPRDAPEVDPEVRAAREAEAAREAARVVLADRAAQEARRLRDEGKSSPPQSDEPASG